MSSIKSLIILAMEGKSGVSPKDIATYVRTNAEDQKVNIERVTSLVRYHTKELEDMGVIIREKRGAWVKFRLADSVEILNGMVVSGNGNTKTYEDDVGRIMRMTDEDGYTTIRMLDMM